MHRATGVTKYREQRRLKTKRRTCDCAPRKAHVGQYAIEAVGISCDGAGSPADGNIYAKTCLHGKVGASRYGHQGLRA